MQHTTCLAAIERWLESCVDRVPLEACTDPHHQQSLGMLLENYPHIRGSLVEAVLGLRVGLIDRAHEIVQKGATSMDRYLHGVVHRIEGDFWNSKYWFRQVHDQGLSAAISCVLTEACNASGMLEQAKSRKIVDDQNRFLPQELVDAQSNLNSKSTSNERLIIQQIAEAEWKSLWTRCREELLTSINNA